MTLEVTLDKVVGFFVNSCNLFLRATRGLGVGSVCVLCVFGFLLGGWGFFRAATRV